MYQIDLCQCCTNRDLKRWPALISPFVASYVLRATPGMCELCECLECGHRFFDMRYDDAETARLYSDYRGEAYLRERHRCEFWYTRKVNDGIGHDPAEIELRKTSLQAYLGGHINPGQIVSVLDYGGDRGQFIPGGIGREQYVYDVSQAMPATGVLRIGSVEELKQHDYDLIMLCHVLEHCSDVRKMLGALRDLARKETLYYFEVPYERFGLTWVRSSGWYGAYLNVIRRAGPMLRLIDFYSSATRIYLNTIPPMGFVKLHEHINYFSQQSLKTILLASGFEVIDPPRVGEFRLQTGSSRFLRCLARVKGTTGSNANSTLQAG